VFTVTIPSFLGDVPSTFANSELVLRSLYVGAPFGVVSSGEEDRRRRVHNKGE
jgi:hypothetical protein